MLICQDMVELNGPLFGCSLCRIAEYPLLSCTIRGGGSGFFPYLEKVRPEQSVFSETNPDQVGSLKFFVEGLVDI